MSFTPNFTIPYQALTDAPDGPNLCEDGFLAVDAALTGLDARLDVLEAKATYVKINESILTVAAASVTFSSIPGTYRSLVLECASRGDAAQQFVGVSLRYNGDSGTTYDYEQLTGAGSAPQAFEALNATSTIIGETPGATTVAGSAAVHTVVIPWYAGAAFWKLHTASHALSGQTSGGQASQLYSKHWVGRWRSTAAITSITILASAGNFVAGSSFALYGLP